MSQSFFAAFNKAKEKTKNVVADVSNNISLKLQMNLSVSPPGSPKLNSVKSNSSQNNVGLTKINNDSLSCETLPPKVFSVTQVSCGGSAPTIKFSEPVCMNALNIDNSSLKFVDSSCDKVISNVASDICSGNQNPVFLNSHSSTNNISSLQVEDLMGLANVNQTFIMFNEFSKTPNFNALNFSKSSELKSQMRQFVLLMKEKLQNLNCRFKNSVTPLPIEVEVFINNYTNLSEFLLNFGWSEETLFSDEVLPPANFVPGVSIVPPHSNFPYPNDTLTPCLPEENTDQIVGADESINDFNISNEINVFKNYETPLNDTVTVNENCLDLKIDAIQNPEFSISPNSNVNKEFSESPLLPHSNSFETSKAVLNQDEEVKNSTANLKDFSTVRVEKSLPSNSSSQCNIKKNDACFKVEKVDPYWHCIFCNDTSHSSHVCNKFSDNKQFWTVIYDEQRCKNCFRQFHQSHKCYDSSFCFLRNCRRRDKHSPVVCSHRYKSSNFKIPFENYFHSSNVYDANFSYQDRSYSNNVSPKTYVSQGTQTEIYNLNTVMVQTENCGSISIGVQTPAHIPREIESSLSSLDSKILEISSSITFETATSADSVSRSPLEICTVSSSLPPQSTESHPVSSSSKCEVNTVNSNTSNSFDPDELTLSFYRMMMPKLRNLPKGGYQNPYL